MLRFFYIFSLLSKYLTIYLLLKLRLYKKPKQKIIRNFFEEASGSFIKFGQLLALRVDVLPKEYSLEMIGLFDSVKPFPYYQVEQTFIQELGATPQKIFKDFQKAPFASASFGQVHGAKFANDHIVAVKIMRPGIVEEVNIDFFIIDILAYIADLFYKIDALPWREFAKEFKKWTKEELDYQIEAGYMEKMYKNVAVNKNVTIPKVYSHLSTKKILVEDYIEGIPLSRVLIGLKDGRLNQEKLQKRGIDLKKITSLITYELLREYFLTDLFHADPHPGNVLILPENRIAFLDFGIMGKPLEYNKYSFVKWLETGISNDRLKGIYHFANFTSEELKNIIGSAIPASSSQDHVEEMIKLLSKHFEATVSKILAAGREDLKVMKTDYVVVFLTLVKAAQKYRVRLPNEIIRFIRTLSIIGFLAKDLNYDYKLVDEIKNFLKKHPVDTIIGEDASAPPFKRINREKAIEQLNNWLSYLVEIDPVLYQLVKEKFKEYNAVER
jgi:ubiquinone biosynthesis protein